MGAHRTYSTKMRHIAAYFLAVLGGNNAPDAAAIKNILDAAGASADDAQIADLLEKVGGKDIWEVVAEGSEKLATVPPGGGRAAGVLLLLEAPPRRHRRR